MISNPPHFHYAYTHRLKSAGLFPFHHLLHSNQLALQGLDDQSHPEDSPPLAVLYAPVAIIINQYQIQNLSEFSRNLTLFQKGIEEEN